LRGYRSFRNPFLAVAVELHNQFLGHQLDILPTSLVHMGFGVVGVVLHHFVKCFLRQL
jgi:hypothetical protein